MNTALWQLFLGVGLISLVGPFVKILAPEVPPSEIAALRSIVVFGALLLWRIATGKSIRQLPINLGDRWQLFGAACIAINALSAITAVALTSTATALLLTNSTPVYMGLYNWVFNKKAPTGKEWAIMAGSFFCLSIFLREGMQGGFWGVVAGFIGGLTWTGYIFAQSKLGMEGKKSLLGEPLSVGTLLLGNAVAAISLTVVTILGPGFVTPSVSNSGLLVAMGVLQSAIPGLLWAAALPKVDPVLRGLAPSLIAVISPLLTRSFLGEPFPGLVETVAAITLHIIVVFSVWRQARK